VYGASVAAFRPAPGNTHPENYNLKSAGPIIAGIFPFASQLRPERGYLDAICDDSPESLPSSLRPQFERKYDVNKVRNTYDGTPNKAACAWSWATRVVDLKHITECLRRLRLLFEDFPPLPQPRPHRPTPRARFVHLRQWQPLGYSGSTSGRTN
jgi:hypothetical protein